MRVVDFLVFGVAAGVPNVTASTATAILTATTVTTTELSPVHEAEIGAVMGFISDNGFDSYNCYKLIEQNQGMAKKGLDDIERALQNNSMPELSAGLKELAFAIALSSDLRKACMAQLLDLNVTLQVLSTYKGIGDAVAHMWADLVHDGTHIFNELSTADTDYKQGNFTGAGVNVGMALRKTLVAEASAHAAPNASSSGWEQLLAGVMVGFVSDDVGTSLACAVDVKRAGIPVVSSARDLERAWRDKNFTALGDVLNALADAMDAAPNVRRSCDLSLKRLEAVLKALRKLHEPEDLIANLLKDGDKIFSMMAHADQVYLENQFQNAGEQLGMALRRALIGEARPNASSVADRFRVAVPGDLSGFGAPLFV